MSNANQPTAPTNNNGSGDGINTNMISMNYGYTQQQQQSSPHMNYQQKPPQISANSIYHPQQMYNNVPPVYTPNSTQIPHYNHHQQQQQQQLLPPLPTQPTPTDGNFLPPPVPLNNSYESELNNIKSNDDIMEFKLNDNKIKEYKTGELKEDYLKLCDLNIRNFQILHKIYMHLPNNLESDKRNKDYSIVALFYMAYMTVAKDLCMKYDSIEDLDRGSGCRQNYCKQIIETSYFY
ncbi:nuclear transcription factor Y subunit gamma-like [Melanaphis sacchari]|uniref:nuclear transcription factor Y subunit gamma-like n=1 Tax=Melanaphis sacchari TaxID=742174 RepID=UPI000DC12E6B|nr:nuclear transcription factor Y subunit gamma-like [Melanaphis sacchari]